MTMNNCYITTTDPITYHVKTAEETADLLGDDFLEEWGHYLDPVLIRRYKKVWREFWDVQKEIRDRMNHD
jgi:hypothetical protein